MQSGWTTIKGTVQDESGRPIAEASLYFISAPVPLPDIAALSGVDGSFVLSVPAAGTYRIGVRSPGYALGEVTVDTSKQSESVLIQLGSETR
jgi:Carboxypeptidase regulatory-like domain